MHRILTKALLGCIQGVSTMAHMSLGGAPAIQSRSYDSLAWAPSSESFYTHHYAIISRLEHRGPHSSEPLGPILRAPRKTLGSPLTAKPLRLAAAEVIFGLCLTQTLRVQVPNSKVSTQNHPLRDPEPQ